VSLGARGDDGSADQNGQVTSSETTPEEALPVVTGANSNETGIAEPTNVAPDPTVAPSTGGNGEAVPVDSSTKDQTSPDDPAINTNPFSHFVAMNTNAFAAFANATDTKYIPTGLVANPLISNDYLSTKNMDEVSNAVQQCLSMRIGSEAAGVVNVPNMFSDALARRQLVRQDRPHQQKSYLKSEWND